MDRYLVDSSLTDEEQKVLKMKNVEDYIGDLQRTQLDPLQKSRLVKYMKRLQPLFNTLTRFQGAIDSFAQADPYGVLSLVWGSVRMVLIVGIDVSNLLDDLVSFFSQIDDKVGRLTGKSEPPHTLLPTRV